MSNSLLLVTFLIICHACILVVIADEDCPQDVCSGFHCNMTALPRLYYDAAPQSVTDRLWGCIVWATELDQETQQKLAHKPDERPDQDAVRRAVHRAERNQGDALAHQLRRVGLRPIWFVPVHVDGQRRPLQLQRGCRWQCVVLPDRVAALRSSGIGRMFSSALVRYRRR